MPETWIPNFRSLTDAELGAMARTSSDFAGAAAYVLQLRREIGALSPLARIADPFIHPEDSCQECSRENVLWFAPNEIWNRVIPDRVSVLCPVCFVKRAEASGFRVPWELRPEGTETETETA